MNFNHKFKTLSAFSFLAITCILSADNTDAKLRNLESRISAMESRKSGCMVNPPARPTQKCDWGGYITIDPLLLKPQENGLEFVVVTNNVGQAASGNPSLFGRSKIKAPKFKWDWGFRLGVGANLPHDAWDVYLNWTRFRTHHSRHIFAGANQLLTPIFVNNENGTLTPLSNPASLSQFALTNAKSKWQLRFNEIDLEVGREFFASKWLVLKPHAGLATAWIRQKDKIGYRNWLNPGGAGTFVSNAFVNMKNNFWGIGLRGGLDTQWGLTCGFSLFADFAASFLYGYFDLDHDEFYTYATGAQVDFFDAKDFFHVDRVITDVILGIRYDYMFCDDRYHLGVQVGWEHHIYWGQNQFQRFVGTRMPGIFVANQGDLTLQGFSAEVRFDF